jgi:hypothetical protein
MNKVLASLLILVLGGCGQERVGSGEGIGTERGDNDAVVAPAGRILRAGIFSPVSGGKPIDSPDTSTGKALSKLVMTFIRESDRILIKKDTILGYQYRLSNLPDTHSVQLRRVLKHPEFRLPDGSVSSGSDYTIHRRVEHNEVFGYDVYALNEDYEMVDGEWTFQIWFDDKLLVEQEFTTFWPEADHPAAAGETATRHNDD